MNAKPGRPKHRHGSKKVELIWLEELIGANLEALFPGMQVLEFHPFHVTRDADTRIRELEAEDLLETIEEGLKQRRFGSVVRLMVSAKMPRQVLNILTNNLEIDKPDVYRVEEPLGLSRLMALYAIERGDLKYSAFVPLSPRISSHQAPGMRMGLPSFVKETFCCTIHSIHFSRLWNFYVARHRTTTCLLSRWCSTGLAGTHR